MYVCMYVCIIFSCQCATRIHTKEICTHMHTSAWVYVTTRIHSFASYMYDQHTTHICTYTRIYTINIHIHMNIRMHIHTYIHNQHAYTHEHTYAHTHVYTCSGGMIDCRRLRMLPILLKVNGCSLHVCMYGIYCMYVCM